MCQAMLLRLSVRHRSRYIQNFQDLHVFGENLEDISKYALDIGAGHGYFNRNEESVQLRFQVKCLFSFVFH